MIKNRQFRLHYGSSVLRKQNKIGFIDWFWNSVQDDLKISLLKYFILLIWKESHTHRIRSGKS